MELHEIDYNSNYIIISDIHGNYESFKAVLMDALMQYGLVDDYTNSSITELLNKAKNIIKGFIFLGDYVGDYPFGSEIVHLMMEIKKNYEVYAIAGNRETGMAKKFYKATKDYYKDGKIDLKEAERLTGWSLETSMGAPLLDFSRLTKEEMEFLVNLPDTIILENSKQIILLKHQMPLDDEEKKILEDKGKEINAFGERKLKIILSAHTHEPNYGVFNDMILFNPGSCGLTDNGDKGAYYGILNHGKLIHFKKDYDYEKLVSDLRKVHLLYDKCENWGTLLEYSIKYGVNSAALYAYEKNRIKRIIQELPKDSFDRLKSFNSEQANTFIKRIVPILSKNEKPFATCLSTNFNPLGGYINRTILVSRLEDKSLKQEKETIENHVVSNNVSNKPINIELPQNIIEIINKIAYEYTLTYCKEYANEVEIIEQRKKN